MDYQYIDFQGFFKLFQYPLWYRTFYTHPLVREVFYGENENIPLVQSWGEADSGKRKRRKEVRSEIYHLIQQALSRDAIVFGDSGKNWDRERKPIERIVIHCYEYEGFTHDDFASVIPLVIQYVPSYANAKEGDERYGKSLWSNHFDDNGKMQFWTYHWLMKADGSIKRLLKDGEIGWHAGNWDVNTCSVAISLPIDFDQNEPGLKVLQSTARLIREHYPHLPKENIIGHIEVPRSPKYTNKIYCPGKTLLALLHP